MRPFAIYFARCKSRVHLPAGVILTLVLLTPYKFTHCLIAIPYFTHSKSGCRKFGAKHLACVAHIKQARSMMRPLITLLVLTASLHCILPVNSNEQLRGRVEVETELEATVSNFFVTSFDVLEGVPRSHANSHLPFLFLWNSECSMV